MPIFGLGLHVIVALFFAIHAVRTGREMYWLLILFMFPLFGSIVYFAVVFLPSTRLEHGARKAGNALQKTLDPGRALREAQRAFDLTPTAHHQMTLAVALLAAGRTAQAVEQYEACLRGPFANDAEIVLGAARAHLANGTPQPAIALLTTLRERQPNFRPEQTGLLLAQASAGAGLHAQARELYEATVQRFGSIEARTELACWAVEHGDAALAQRELDELAHARRHMTRQTRALHAALFKRADAAAAALARRQDKGASTAV